MIKIKFLLYPLKIKALSSAQVRSCQIIGILTGENHYWYVVAGYTIPDTGIRIGADYLDGKADGDNAYEVVGRIFL